MIDASGITDAIFVNGDGMRLIAADAKQSCAARKKLGIRTVDGVVCILVFGSNK